MKTLSEKFAERDIVDKSRQKQSTNKLLEQLIQYFLYI